MRDDFFINFYYAEIDSDGYCVGLSQLSDSVENDSLIRIESMDDSYFNRKYDRGTESWTNEYRPEPEPVQTVTLEDVKKDIKHISETTQMTTEDALTIIEYLMMLEEKIDALSVK